MSTNPDQSQRKSDPADRYGGYTGYTPSSSAEDPYGAYTQQTNTGPRQQSDPNYVYGQGSQASQQSYGQGSQQSYGQAGQQQQQYYQPPSSVTGRKGGQSSYTGSAAGQSTSNSLSRRFAFFSYLGACFTGIFFFFNKKRDSYVRYHAAQSVALFTPILAALLVIAILHGLLGWIPILGWLIGIVLGFLNFVILVPATILWIALMVTSFLGITIRIPYVSTYADALIARFSRKSTV